MKNFLFAVKKLTLKIKNFKKKFIYEFNYILFQPNSIVGTKVSQYGR